MSFEASKRTGLLYRYRLVKQAALMPLRLPSLSMLALMIVLVAKKKITKGQLLVLFLLFIKSYILFGTFLMNYAQGIHLKKKYARSFYQ